MRYILPIFHKICRILVGMYLLCLRSPRCDFELIFIVYLVGDVAARHPSPRVHQLGDPSNSIWSYSRNYNQTRCEVINLFWLSTPCPLEYSRIKNKIGPLQAPLNALLHTTQSYCLNNFEKKVVALTLIGMGFSLIATASKFVRVSISKGLCQFSYESDLEFSMKHARG